MIITRLLFHTRWNLWRKCPFCLSLSAGWIFCFGCIDRAGWMQCLQKVRKEQKKKKNPEIEDLSWLLFQLAFCRVEILSCIYAAKCRVASEFPLSAPFTRSYKSSMSIPFGMGTCYIGSQPGSKYRFYPFFLGASYSLLSSHFALPNSVPWTCTPCAPPPLPFNSFEVSSPYSEMGVLRA